MHNRSSNVDRFAPNQWRCGRISHGIMGQGPNNDDGVHPGWYHRVAGLGGSVRARAKHELHHVIVTQAPPEPHLDRFAAQLPDWLSNSALRQSRS
jgi:hypothetical protein|eukprot:COSAG06_NODE_3059_length_5911_cov_2.902099_2_plen_95_part_00